jgi:hypothetical protein
MTTDLNTNLKKQCAEQRERCLYTSVSLYIWLRVLRQIRIGFIVLPIIFGGIAGWDLLKGEFGYPTVTAVFALLAGILPAVYSALKLDDHLPLAAKLAGEYKNLEILFGVMENVSSLKPFADFETEFKAAMARLEAANAHAYTAPEWCFKRAQQKVKSGDYSFNEK